MVLLTLLMLSWQPAAAAADCRAPRKVLPALIALALESGDERITGGATADMTGGPAPVKSLHFEEDGVTHFLQVLVLPGKAPGELKPAGFLLGSMAKAQGQRERWMFRATPKGRLELAGLFRDRVVGEEKDHRREQYKKFGPHEPTAFAQFEKELKAVCRLKDRPRSIKLLEASAPPAPRR